MIELDLLFLKEKKNYKFFNSMFFGSFLILFYFFYFFIIFYLFFEKGFKGLLGSYIQSLINLLNI
jgi:hypothetical protein